MEVKKIIIPTPSSTKLSSDTNDKSKCCFSNGSLETTCPGSVYFGDTSTLIGDVGDTTPTNRIFLPGVKLPTLIEGLYDGLRAGRTAFLEPALLEPASLDAIRDCNRKTCICSNSLTRERDNRK